MFILCFHSTILGINLLTELFAPVEVDDALVILGSRDVLGDEVDVLDEAGLEERVPRDHLPAAAPRLSLADEHVPLGPNSIDFMNCPKNRPKRVPKGFLKRIQV